ncbi:MAG TPA: helix-turn-helix transcriptional regulator [Anaerolineae bacterium]|nr:helix-turn-helix transcriptional regulator [Anaerolineae bacterium]HXV98202.1 helix-turn-helix transcriptional regulator [Anaerolineae bacterium]
MGKRRINNNIRTLRFFRDEMTQQQLAEKVGVTRQTIIAIEKGNYSPSLELAFRIALVFEVPLEEVFSYDLEDEAK